MKSAMFFITAAVLLSLSPAHGKDRGDTLAEAREAGEATLRVLYVPADGWAERDESGELTGVTVEIMRRFADYVGSEEDIALALDFVAEEDWSVFYERVRDGEGGVFGLGNVTITEERGEELAFSPPYVTNVAVLISHEDQSGAERAEDLPEAFEGLRALAFAGTLHQQRLEAMQDEHWPGLAIDKAHSNDEIIERVSKGDHFAYIDAYNYHRACERGAPVRAHSAFDDPGEQFGIIMPLESDWQPVIEDFFAAGPGLVESDYYRHLLQQHLGEAVAEVLLGQ